MLTGLVVDLGDAGTLRDRLAAAVGDPSLRVGFWRAVQARYVDEHGRAVAATGPMPDRTVTPIGDGPEPVAIVVHDPAALSDRVLVGEVAAAVRLAVSNVRLDDEVRAALAGVAASRRRIVEAADIERRNVQARLRDGVQRRLARAVELLDGCGAPVGDAGIRRCGAGARTACSPRSAGSPATNPSIAGCGWGRPPG